MRASNGPIKGYLRYSTSCGYYLTSYRDPFVVLMSTISLQTILPGKVEKKSNKVISLSVESIPEELDIHEINANAIYCQ